MVVRICPRAPHATLRTIVAGIIVVGFAPVGCMPGGASPSPSPNGTSAVAPTSCSTTLLLDPWVTPGQASVGGWDLLDAATVRTEVPYIDVRWLDPERRERGADLASVICPVMQRLREPDADRGVGL